MAEIPRVLNVLLLDADGKRVAVKYFDEEMTGVAHQMAYERSVFQKTSRTNARGEAEIAVLDKQLVVRGQFLTCEMPSLPSAARHLVD